MKAIIVAAGVGSRLGELTKELPKSLIDVMGNQFLKDRFYHSKNLELTTS